MQFLHILNISCDSDRKCRNLFVCLMAFDATFGGISVVLGRSVLLVEETGVPGEGHRSVASH